MAIRRITHYGSFCGATIWFSEWGGGYIGLQTDSLGKHVDFAIWDDAENSGSANSTDITCKRFTGEGTGTNCLFDYPWIAGREYNLRIWATTGNQNFQTWGAWVIDTVAQQETYIGSITLNNSTGYNGYGWLTSSTTWLERYAPAPGGCAAQPLAQIAWRGPYANNYNGYGNGSLPTGAIVSYGNASCSNFNVGSIGPAYVYMQDGSTASPGDNQGTDLWAGGVWWEKSAPITGETLNNNTSASKQFKPLPVIKTAN